MLRVVCNIQVHKIPKFILTLIKQEKLVCILVILYIQEYSRVFTKLFTGTRVSEDVQFHVSGSRNNQKRTALHSETNYSV